MNINQSLSINDNHLSSLFFNQLNDSSFTEAESNRVLESNI